MTPSTHHVVESPLLSESDFIAGFHAIGEDWRGAKILRSAWPGVSASSITMATVLNRAALKNGSVWSKPLASHANARFVAMASFPRRVSLFRPMLTSFPRARILRPSLLLLRNSSHISSSLSAWTACASTTRGSPEASIISRAA